MAEVGSSHYKALFAAAFVLIVIVFILNAAARLCSRLTMGASAEFGFMDKKR